MPDILVTSSDRAAIALDLEARNAPEPETLADVAAALGVTLQEAQDPVFLGTLAAEMSWEEGGLGRGNGDVGGGGDVPSSAGGEAPAFALQTGRASRIAKPLPVAAGNAGRRPPAEDGTSPSRKGERRRR